MAFGCGVAPGNQKAGFLAFAELEECSLIIAESFSPFPLSSLKTGLRLNGSWPDCKNPILAR